MAALTEEHKQKMAEGRRRSRAQRAQQQTQELPKSDVVVDIQAAIANTVQAPSDDGMTWISPSGETIRLDEAPPWAQHVVGKGRDATDARQFVKVPDNWYLRWRSPKSLDSVGQLGWMPVTISTPGVTPLVRSMVAPDNTIRRGYNGDILHFMPKQWWDKRVAEKQAAVARLSGKAMNEQQQFVEDANRGKYGRYIRGGTADGDRGKFPVATGFDAARGGDHPE